MDKEKSKKIDFTPSNWLYVFLFIYYSIWVLQLYESVSYYIIFGLDSFNSFGLVDWLCFFLFTLAGIYSFYAVIKTLRGDRDCITSLKWSLVLVLIYTLMNPTRGQIPTYSIWVWGVAFFIRPLFYLIFYLYLCFAKGIKHRYPKTQRVFRPSGWVWTVLLIAYAGVGIYGVWEQYQISQHCKPVDVKTLKLNPGDICDGYVLFHSDREWNKWVNSSDTLYIKDRIEIFPTIMSADSLSRIYIASGICVKPDARTYNKVIVSALTDLMPSVNNVDLGKLKEISFTDTIVSGKRMMSTIYEATVDSNHAYYDVVMITELKSRQCCVTMLSDKRKIRRDWAIEFADDLRFDLKKIAKCQNNENCSNSKNKNAYRTSKSHH